MPRALSVNTHPRVAVVQDGARLHYAVPVALQAENALDSVYTPWYVKPGSLASAGASLYRKVNPVRGQKLAERTHPKLDPSRVHTNLRLAIRHGRGRSRLSGQAFWNWESNEIGDWISSKGFGQANALFGFVRNISPTLCQRAKDAELVVVTDQMIATSHEEQRQERVQAERFPDWSSVRPASSDDDAKLRSWEEQTWSASHAFTCASDYVKTSLIERGISADRISVLPYPIEASHYQFADRAGRQSGALTVGFVGYLGLRKGTPYLLQVAQRLRSANVKFVLVGGASVDPSHFAAHANVTCLGPVPRGDVLKHLASFDILLFPSTCEGSPGAVMEAMATGLPVVTSPNSGTVVRDGLDGFIRPYDDVDALAASVETLLRDEPLRLEMGRNARERAASFTLENYGKLLTAKYRALLAPR